MNTVLRQIVRQSFSRPTLRSSTLPNHYLSISTGLRSNSSNAPTQPTTFDKDTLAKLVRTNKVVVFMKGNPEAPRCGFSNAVVQIMRMHGVEYDAHDVLQNEELRQSIKEFTDWPTIPQVFINGEFVGGCDILLQMHQSGDLIEELQKAGIESALLKASEAAEKKGAQKDKK